MNKLLMCNPFNNVVASGIANVDLSPFLGSTLECINLSLGGGAFTKAMITLIQLKANAKVIWESSGSFLDSLENYKNYAAADATKLSINFMEQKGRTLNSFQAGALYLGNGAGITNLRLEVSIAGATAPTLSAIAELSPGVPMEGEQGILYLFKRRHRNSQTIGAAGTFALQVPHIDPSGGGSVYQRIACFSANMTAMRLQREGVTEFEVTKAENECIQKKAGRSPQANLFVFDPILDQVQAGRVWDTSARVTKSAQFYATFSAGETITIESEELLPMNMY